MKFTQDDLLNAMGLKVGDKVRIFGQGIYRVITTELDGIRLSLENPETYLWKIVADDLSIEFLIGSEYTVIPQPKYILTDEDKILVTNIEIVGFHLKDQFVSRNSNGYLHLSVHEKNVLFLNKDFLKCIGNNTSISLYELKEIAKK